MPSSVLYALGAGVVGGFSAAGAWTFAWGAFAAALVVGPVTRTPAKIT
jgi:hypothetical protein